jgi:tetratricopeptide (TPR) repeat protein
MVSRFCTQCGAKLLAEARYCAACGRAVVGGSAQRRSRFPIERWAPALVVGAVLAIGATAVLTGARSAAPPNVPPPRDDGQVSGAPPPPGHPSVEVPDDVRKVIAKLADAVKDKPDDLEAWQQLGFVQYRAGQVDPTYLAQADATYSHVLERQPENLEVLRALGNIAFDRNQPDRALEYYRRYLKLKPDDLGVQTDVGTMLLSSQQVDAALKAYRDVLAVDPNFFQAQFNLAIAYRAAGDEAKALAALERARDIAGDDATRQRVNDLLARVKGESPPSGEAQPGEAAVGGLRGEIEAIFRAHPIVGPKLDRIDWPSDDHVQVVLRDFPMDGMPPMVRDKFIDRIRNGVRDSATRHAASAPITVELIDAASGRVMQAVTVEPGAAAPAAAAAAAPAAAPAGGGMRGDIEAIFRNHPIVGPKLDRVDWPSDTHARVLLREFPMEQMPPMVREKFTERIRSGVRDSKQQHQSTAAITVELVDAANGHVMETVTE